MGSTIGDCGIEGWFGYEDWWVKNALRVELDQAAAAPVTALVEVASFVFEPVDYVATGLSCLSGDCSIPLLIAAALPGVPGSVGRHEDEVGAVINHFVKQVAERADKPALKLVDGMRLSTDDALQAAIDFLGEGYKDLGNGRFISADGFRQVRMGDSDILGTHPGAPGPHMNFETFAPDAKRPGRWKQTENLHILLED
jgi:hypothetical protein